MANARFWTKRNRLSTARVSRQWTPWATHLCVIRFFLALFPFLTTLDAAIMGDFLGVARWLEMRFGSCLAFSGVENRLHVNGDDLSSLALLSREDGRRPSLTLLLEKSLDRQQ